MENEMQFVKFFLTPVENCKLNLMDIIRMFFGQRCFYFGKKIKENGKERLHYTFKSFSREETYEYAYDTVSKRINDDVFVVEELTSYRKNPLKYVWSAIATVDN
jgi:hypothetical protein